MAPRTVHLIASQCLHAAGQGAAALLAVERWQAHAPVFAQGLPACPAAPVEVPAGLFDRRLLRGLEPQSLRLLACAGAMAPALQGRDPSRTALAAALPEIDEPSPCWDACAAALADGRRPVAALLAATPPLHGLMLLNTSVLALLAEGLGCRGAMAGFCTQDEASGIDALREGAQQIAEGDADTALVLAGSPSLLPARYLRAAPAEGDAAPPGEGACALVLAAAAPDDAPVAEVLAIVDRQAMPATTGEVLAEVVEAALARAGLAAQDIALVSIDADLPAPSALAQVRRLAPARQRVGALGPAAPLADLALLLEAAPRHGVHVMRIGLAEGGRCSAIVLRRLVATPTEAAA